MNGERGSEVISGRRSFHYFYRRIALGRGPREECIHQILLQVGAWKL